MNWDNYLTDFNSHIVLPSNRVFFFLPRGERVNPPLLAHPAEGFLCERKTDFTTFYTTYSPLSLCLLIFDASHDCIVIPENISCKLMLTLYQLHCFLVPFIA